MNRLKVKSVLIPGMLFLLALSVFILPSNTALADSASFCRFTGSINTGEGEVAGGTLVTAVIEGKEFHTHTPAAGDSATYSITIIPPQGQAYADGTLVHFKVNGVPAEQVGSFKTGSNIKLDLTASASGAFENKGVSSISPYAGPSNGNSSINWGVIIGVFMATLATGAIAYYMIILRRVMRKGLLKQRVTGNQVVPRKQTVLKK